jgi:hypothetical protein
MKNIILASVLTSILSSCAVMPEGEEPVLQRRGIGQGMITVIQPVETQLEVSLIRGKVRFSNKGHHVN